MENQQPEALVLASLFERCVIAFGETETSSRAIAAKELRRLHTRVEELEAMLDAVGGGGVSSQRVTQAKDHIAQDRKMVSAPVVLPDGWKIVPVEPTPPMVEAGATERITPHITAGHGAIAAFKAMLEHAPECPALASTPAAAPAPAQEPFGYFKAEPFGWRDCAATDEGAVALYEAPQPQADGRDVERLLEIVRAIERAFQELPENFAINIKLAKGVAAGFLSGPGLTERRIANGDFVEDINAAIDAAIAAAKESR